MDVVGCVSMLPNMYTLVQALVARQVSTGCLADESAKNYGNWVWGSSGLTGDWQADCYSYRWGERRAERAEERGMNGQKEGKREMIVRVHAHTHSCELCVCLSQWQTVYHVAINLPTITLWCPGWRRPTGVFLTPAHFVSWLCVCPFLSALPGLLPFARIHVCGDIFNTKKCISGSFWAGDMPTVDRSATPPQPRWLGSFLKFRSDVLKWWCQVLIGSI